ncbi:DEAD/DEAH box helicase [Paucibacter sp. B2R-40]|uniref:DEAD/DEAH box helicase n=1 Tax=Paucibacter sp. B2R-40 TaxID=2893554 RepID=UPI0021E4B9C1|nr:DEAD/DEAH box helicase [Paucibacter sp. B2R-40]MCV2356553.1 DEAD/DEAH box helicase [Paucibacter sp. B2R-40]
MTSEIFPSQRPWSFEAASALLDMSGKLPGFEDIGEQQLKAAMALHRMLISQGCAYLADEVGMGKTYVALAVVALFRHLQPGFRVLYLAPSQNVMRKWHSRELPAFIRSNVRQPDMRVQGPAGLPPAASFACVRVDDWVTNAVTAPSTPDVFLTLSALSFHLTGDTTEGWANRVRTLAALAGAPVDFRGVKTKAKFKERAAGLVNAAIPYYDLLVVDEAHLLKSGAGKGASDRANFLANALGVGEQGGTRKFGAALLLSGTPFDRDLMQLVKQFELFASPHVSPAPHERIREVAEQRRAGGGWSEVQAGLKPYMIRRVQELKVGLNRLSRNQYRIERRAEAGISLAGKSDPETLQQRLFTAVVQKRLVEHLQGENGGQFPMAMFSSWEAYAPPQTAKVEKEELADEDGRGLPSGATLDVELGSGPASDAQAIDGTLIGSLVGSYREVFGKEPPHPKLEVEAKRLGREAFSEGDKQLVFVRRLKSVDDLYSRLNQEFDDWFVQYLVQEGMPGSAIELSNARDQSRKTLVASPAATGATTSVEDEPEVMIDDKEVEIPAGSETLFSWFFRGKLDPMGARFADVNRLPHPKLLRDRLRDPRRLEAIIGELDWRHFIMERCSNLPQIPFFELAETASKLAGAANELGRHRRLQCAWALLMADKLPQLESMPFRHLHEYLLELISSDRQEEDLIDMEQAEVLLSAPTIGLALYQSGLGKEILPAWDTVWSCLHNAAEPEDGSALAKANSQLRELDLQRELLFALLRLDHPFIDLYLGWWSTANDDSNSAAKALVARVVAICARPERVFGTASILRSLAEAWPQIAKTNFAEFLKGADRVKRNKWRLTFQQQMSPFAPVEWASGQNTSSRTSIARRFRMPGYPMVLITTSVLQEGEDLHVCCDRVTHFGISGSPIGIEQKNGRVDRIGSRAQRNLQAGLSVEEAGIRVTFPHLRESLEWFQIRDLSQNINDYLRSLNHVGSKDPQDSASLSKVVGDIRRIPPLLSYRLQSPFEPELFDSHGCVEGIEVARCFSEAKSIITHATNILAEVASKCGFKQDAAHPECHIHPEMKVKLSLRPAHTTGELSIHASRPLQEAELPAWLRGLSLEDGRPNLDDIMEIAADRLRKYGLMKDDDGRWQLHVHAACFAKSEAELDREEVLDLIKRVDVPVDFSPPNGTSADLFRILQETIDYCNSGELIWAPSKNQVHQTLRYRGLKISVKIWKAWMVISRVIEDGSAYDNKQVLHRTLLRNQSHIGPDFIFSKNGSIEARMIHPVKYLGAQEMWCILGDIASVPAI